jgi:hypothetical protein
MVIDGLFLFCYGSSSLICRALWMPPILCHSSICKELLTSNFQTLAAGLAFTVHLPRRNMMTIADRRAAQVRVKEPGLSLPWTAFVTSGPGLGDCMMIFYGTRLFIYIYIYIDFFQLLASTILSLLRIQCARVARNYKIGSVSSQNTLDQTLPAAPANGSASLRRVHLRA